MSADILVARARGLGTRRLVWAGLGPRTVEDVVRARTEAELALLARWDDDDALVPLWLDEDRRTLRAIARGLVANVGAGERTAGAIATRTLPRRRIDELSRAASFAEVQRSLGAHVLAPAFAATELLEVERGLATRYFTHAKLRDAAFRVYRTQCIDVENAQAALMRAADFLAGGKRVTAAMTSREQLARAFARTPLAAALFDPAPSAFEDAALAWQLATQAHLRRLSPLGLAPVLHWFLSRRVEARRARRDTWLGGAP